MAEIYAILGTGQSQGNRVGELTKFEDKATETSPRNPAVFPRTPLISRAFKQDKFTLPGSWPEKYKSFTIRGRGTSAVQWLTGYNPVASYYETQNVGSGALYAGHVTPVYPGYAAAQSVQETSNRTQLDLLVSFQADPAGLAITRVSTGTMHNLASGWANTAPGTVFLTEPLDPPLKPGESFKLPLVVTTTGATQSIPSNVRFGGYSDGGSQLEGHFGGGTGAATPNVIGGFTVQPYPVAFAASAGVPLAVVCNTRHFVPGQRVQFTHSGGAHPDLPVATDFWVTRVVYSAGSQRVYVSASRFGAEVVYGGVPAAGTIYINHMPQHVRSTMAGCRVRWLTGAMAGQSFDLTDNTLVSASPTDNFYLSTVQVMPSAPQAGDTFEIIPQQINGEDVEWDEFAHFLPECYLDGQTYGQGSPLLASYPNTSSGTAVTFTMTAGSVYEGMRFRIYDYYALAGATTTPAPSSGSLTGPGQVLYAVNVNYLTSTCNVSTSYGGAPISNATLSANLVTVYIDEHPGRVNTAPPGFNYDNARAVPVGYQPYFGANVKLTTPERGAIYLTSLATAMHQHLGRPIYVIPTNVGGTSLHRREASASQGAGAHHAWFDSAVYLDWSPGDGEVDTCYARMVQALQMAKRAAAAQGNTIKIAGVFNVQGETDAAVASFRASYADNLRALKARVRAKIVELGMWDGPAETIPWWQPKLPTTKGADWGLDGYVSVAELNAAVDEVKAEDPYMVTRAVEDAEISYDFVHYRGDYVWQLGLHAFDDWKTIASFEGDRTRLDICNQALKHVGETRTIVSLTENTTPAKLCNRYYSVALRTLLEQFPWPEATEVATLTKLATNPRESIDWQYAFKLPPNCLSVVSIGGDPAGVYLDSDVEFSAEGSTLYCNLSDVVIRYTTVAPNPERYSQHFTNAMTYQLAAEIAPGLSQGDKGVALAQSMMQMAQFYVSKAKEHAAMRQRHADPDDQRYAWD